MASTSIHPTVARFWHQLESGKIQCDLCPRLCQLQDGQRGMCFVRAREGEQLLLTTYGRSSGFCVDPIEKKPLNHFLPGSSVLSFGTAGCNLGCKFCQNWDISRSKEMDRLADEASPGKIAQVANELGCRSVAFTYNDPVIFLEYAVDVAHACHELGIRTVAVSAGYINSAPRAEFFKVMDAANIDLKAFSEGFYRKLCSGHLEPVLDTLRYLKSETKVWVEITNLLIPGENDSDQEIEQLSSWVADSLGTDIPLHFSAFHPDYRMRETENTPLATLEKARQIALDAGLKFVYTGNVRNRSGSITRCVGCGRTIIERDWYEITSYALDDEGNCANCGAKCPGLFEGPAGEFGSRRFPVSLQSL